MTQYVTRAFQDASTDLSIAIMMENVHIRG